MQRLDWKNTANIKMQAHAKIVLMMLTEQRRSRVWILECDPTGTRRIPIHFIVIVIVVLVVRVFVFIIIVRHFESAAVRNRTENVCLLIYSKP